MSGPLSRHDVSVVIPCRNPPARLAETIQDLAPRVRSIVLVDDASDARMVDGFQGLPGNVSLLVHGTNLGIGAALNTGIGLLLEDRGTAAVLTLDQDAAFSDGQLASLIGAFNDAARRLPRIGCIAPGRMQGTVYQDYGDQEIATTAEVIQSGCLFDVAALREVGPFAAGLFIDCVDTEMCLRMRRNGFDVAVAARLEMPHELGSGRAITVLGRTVLVTDHSPTRRFFITRNRLAVVLAYARSEPGWAARSIRRLIVASMLALTLEADRSAKAAAIWNGLRAANRTRRQVLAIRSDPPRWHS